MKRLRIWSKRLLKILFFTGTLFFAIVAGGLVATYYFGIEHNLFGLPDVSELHNLKPLEASFVYDMDDKLIGCYAKEYRVVLLQNEIPELLHNSIIASEDKRFYQWYRIGIDPFGIARAAWANYLAGKTVEGASTLNQQVAKNWLLTPERNIERKIKEALLAIRMERKFTKKEIMTLYVNTAYLGRGRYGFEAASRAYFGKSVKDLKTEEIAYLVGLIKSPSVSNPIPSKNRALERVYEEGYISETEYSRAYYAPVKILPFRADCSNSAPYFIEEIRKIYKDKLPLLTGGLRVYTTLNSEIQKKAEEALVSGLDAYRTRHPENSSKVEGAVVVLDIKTGDLRAMVGGENFSKNEFNNATQALRQPGSTFKPFADAAYLKYVCKENRINCQFKDSPFPISMGRGLGMHYVQNYPYLNLPEYRGYVNMDIQLAESRNAATMWMAREIEIKWGKIQIPVKLAEHEAKRSERIAHFRKLGYSAKGAVNMYEKEHELISQGFLMDPEERMQWLTDLAKDAGINSKLQPYLVTAIGASEVTVLDITSAFIPFVNGGYKIEPKMVRIINDTSGQSVMKIESNIPVPVFLKSPEPENIKENARIAQNMKELLQGVVDLPTGTAHSLRKTFPEGEIACKTGTATNARVDGKAVPTDNWIICLTPKYAVGVWIGLKDKEDLGNRETGSTNALPIFQKIMKDLNLIEPGGKFISLFEISKDDLPAEGESAELIREEQMPEELTLEEARPPQ